MAAEGLTPGLGTKTTATMSLRTLKTASGSPAPQHQFDRHPTVRDGSVTGGATGKSYRPHRCLPDMSKETHTRRSASSPVDFLQHRLRTLTCSLAGKGQFSSSAKAVRFTGLDITVHSSDRKGLPGRLSRRGPPMLRWAAYEAGKPTPARRLPTTATTPWSRTARTASAPRQAYPMSAPSRATTRPALTTRSRTGWVTTASAGVLALTTTMSARAPGSRP